MEQFKQHQQVKAIETVFVPKKTWESVYEMDILKKYGY